MKVHALHKGFSVLLLWSLSGGTQLAHAKVGYAPGNVDANSLDSADPQCESFCKDLLLGVEGAPVSSGSTKTSKNGNILASTGLLPGSGGKAEKYGDPWKFDGGEIKMIWLPQDDQWCAEHGSPTDEAAYSTNPIPVPSPPYTGGCPYPVKSGENCQTVKRKINRCKLKNSQVESQCIAYYKARQAINWQWLMVTLDTAAAGTCVAACHAPGFGATAAMNCGFLATGAGATELYAVFKMESDDGTLKKILSGGGATVAAGTGFATGLRGAIGGPGTDKDGKVTTNEKEESNIYSTQSTRDEQNKHWNDVSAFGDDVKEGTKFKDKDGKETELKGRDVKNARDAQTQKRNACVTGYTMTAMAALRAWNLYQATSTMSDSCEAVKQLAADATATGATAPQPDAKFNTTPAPTPSVSPVIQ